MTAPDRAAMTPRLLHPEDVAAVFGTSVRAVKYGVIGQSLPWRKARANQ